MTKSLAMIAVSGRKWLNDFRVEKCNDRQLGAEKDSKSKGREERDGHDRRGPASSHTKERKEGEREEWSVFGRNAPFSVGTEKKLKPALCADHSVLGVGDAVAIQTLPPLTRV